MPAERPFVDRPADDLAAATRLATRVASEHGLASPVLLNVGMNAIFRCADVVLRVSHLNGPATSAYALADTLLGAGIEVARPSADRLVQSDRDRDLAVTAWEHIESTGEITDWASVGAMVRRVRALPPASLPADYPVPFCTSYPWWQFDSLLDDVGPDLDGAATRGLRAAVDRHAGWIRESGGPDGWVLCHGDVHPNNVLAGAEGPVIIDWDLLCIGPPGWDHAPLRSMVARWGARPQWYRAFARGYGEDLSRDPVTESLTTLRLVAATLMRVRAGRNDPHARAEAERRLRYWRGDRDAPVWVMS
jgi:hypothetical protein